jgi:hypothetical protein
MYNSLRRFFYFHSVIRLHSKSKVEVHPRTAHDGSEGEQSNNSNLSLASALDGVGDQHHAPAALPPEKTRYPLYRRLGGTQGRSGRVRKISPLTEIRYPDSPARSESLHGTRLNVPDIYGTRKRCTELFAVQWCRILQKWGTDCGK